MMIFTDIEGLIYYANAHLMLDDLDINFVRNAVLQELGISDYIISEVDTAAIDAMTDPRVLLDAIVNHAVGTGLVTAGDAESFGARIMSLVSKRPSELTDIFFDQPNTVKACDWLYDYCIKNNSIRLSTIERNRHWEAKGTKGKLEVTINVSRPERINAEPARPANAKNIYPECCLCAENVGLAAGAQQNVRTIAMTLAGEEWHFRFSPYSYYNQHCVLTNAEHIPMVTNAQTLTKLLDFVDILPHYFIGSNAALPRVGGSVLSHEHFQGGCKNMPMFRAPVRQALKAEGFPLLNVGLVDWYNNVLRISGFDRQMVADLGSRILDAWQGYSDPEIGLIAASTEQHNCVTPIVRRDKEGRYILELILRNNRTDEQHPHGIFHAAPEYHNIKAEAIGLIEAVGLFVLPGRLDTQLGAIERYLTREVKFDAAKLQPDMAVHADMIQRLLAEAGTAQMTALEAQLTVKDEVNRICEQILYNTAVFGQSEAGLASLVRFLATAGLK